MESTVTKIIQWMDANISAYMANPIDYAISDGNVALCIIDKDGTVYGKMYGEDVIRMRNSYLYAWKKASQVWITGIDTGEFERMVFNNEIDEYAFGINRPDYVGWIGGQPVKMDNGEVVSIGFSGFRGETDIRIVIDAMQKIRNGH
jgi:glc operon protein GlcG